MLQFGHQAPLAPKPVTGMETFDPFHEPTISTSAALYGGAWWCPIDPDGNNLCVCLT